MEGVKTILSPILSLDELVDGFGEDYRLRGLTGKTIRVYQANIRSFLKLITDINLSLQEVDQHVLQEFLSYLKDKKELHHKTVKGYFTALSSFYDYP